MTQKEIDKAINEGKELKIKFGIRSMCFAIGTNRITEKQFDAASKRFEGKLDFTPVYGGLTTHIYKLKQ
jgi:hypothetical protein